MEEKINFITERHSHHLVTTGKRLATDVKRILQQVISTNIRQKAKLCND